MIAKIGDNIQLGDIAQGAVIGKAGERGRITNEHLRTVYKVNQ